MSYELRLLLAIKNAEQAGYFILAEALRTMLRNSMQERQR